MHDAVLAVLPPVLDMASLLDTGHCLCRGDYGISVGRNIIHGSDAVEVRLQSARYVLPPDVAGWVWHQRRMGSGANQLGICQACTCCLQSAQKEIALWFKPEELAEYKQMTEAAILE